MKRIALFLLAVVMMAGCSSDDGKLTAADMAGTYSGVDNLDGMTTSYTVVLTSAGTFTEDRVGDMGPLHASGTFTVDDPVLFFTYTAPPSENGHVGYGKILDGGKAIDWSSPAKLTKQ